MTRTFATTLVLVVGLVGTATARPSGSYKWVEDPGLLDLTWQPPPPAAVSHTIYLNNCKPNGCQLSSGYNNALTNTSSVPEITSTLSPYSGSDATWQQIVNCVKQVYSPFDVDIVTTRPTSGNYHMAIVAGTPGQVQQDPNVAGVSPFSCGYIDNSISFAFANLAPNNVPEICWTVAQETAHSWGLDHKYDNRDPMTYLSGGPVIKQFQNEAGACGEYNARSCMCSYQTTGTAKMNSFALIMQTFGSNAPDLLPPTVAITAPTEGAQVMPGFQVRADIRDDRIIDMVELRLDGMVIASRLEEPWAWNAPNTLSQGKHKIEISATDRGGNVSKATVNVQYGTACTTAAECNAAGNVCLDGHCVAGPDMPGGLGTACSDSTSCMSMQCGSDGENQYCVEACDAAIDGCPSGFSCQDTGNGGVCWPSDSGGGCTASGRSASPGLLMLLAIAAMWITRKRRS